MFITFSSYFQLDVICLDGGSDLLCLQVSRNILWTGCCYQNSKAWAFEWELAARISTRSFNYEVVLLQLKHEWKILNFHICFHVFGKYLLSFLCCLFIFSTYNNLCHDVSVRNCSFWTYHVLETVMFSGHGCLWKESSHFPGHLQEPDGLQEGST